MVFLDLIVLNLQVNPVIEESSLGGLKARGKATRTSSGVSWNYLESANRGDLGKKKLKWLQNNNTRSRWS